MHPCKSLYTTPNLVQYTIIYYMQYANLTPGAEKFSNLNATNLTHDILYAQLHYIGIRGVKTVFVYIECRWTSRSNITYV